MIKIVILKNKENIFKIAHLVMNCRNMNNKGIQHNRKRSIFANILIVNKYSKISHL